MKNMIVELKGSITIGQGDVLMRDGIKDLVDQGYELVILDFSKVGYMDSSGMGELMAAHELMTRHGGFLALIGIPAKIHKLLYISVLLEHLNCFKTKEEATSHYMMALAS